MQARQTALKPAWMRLGLVYRSSEPVTGHDLALHFQESIGRCSIVQHLMLSCGILHSA